jgi:hypothetical protein
VGTAAIAPAPLCLSAVAGSAVSGTADWRPGATVLSGVVSAGLPCRPARLALDAIANGTLTIAEIRGGPLATRALRIRTERLSPPPDIGSRGNALSYPLARFLVEVPRSMIEVFVKFGFIRSDQRDDLAGIMAALRRLGQAPPAIRRIA